MKKFLWTLVLKYILLLSVIAIIASCNSTNEYALPKFCVESEAKCVVLNGDLPYNYVNDLFIYDGKAFILAYDIKTQTWLHIYDAVTGDFLSDAITYGRGPNEVQNISGCILEDGVLSICDLMKQKVFSLALFDICSGDVQISEKESDFNRSSVYELFSMTSKSISFLNSNYYDQKTKQFVFNDESGMQKVYDWATFDDPEVERSCYMQPQICVSPDWKHVAVAGSYCGVVDYFDIADKEIVNVRTGRYIFPQINIVNGIIQFKDSYIPGISDLFSDNDYLYLSFGRETLSSSSLHFPLIGVFDWHGKALQSYLLPISVQKFCMSAEGELYAIGENDNGVMTLIVSRVN